MNLSLKQLSSGSFLWGDHLGPLFTGKIKLTLHAKQRLKERNVNAVYVIRQLAFIPYEKGVRKWYIPGTDLFVTYNDHSEKNRTVITLGRNL